MVISRPLLAPTGVEPMPEDFFLLPQPPEAELAVPGCYRSVCVELKLHHLAVCALHKAADIVEMEGGSSMDSVGAPAFKVLRNLVQVGCQLQGPVDRCCTTDTGLAGGCHAHQQP